MLQAVIHIEKDITDTNFSEFLETKMAYALYDRQLLTINHQGSQFVTQKNISHQDIIIKKSLELFSEQKFILGVGAALAGPVC